MATNVWLSAVACLAGCPPTWAQDEAPVRAVPATLDGIHGGDYRRGGYDERMIYMVYGVGWQDQTGGSVAGPLIVSTVYDDVTFGSTCSSYLPVSLVGFAAGFWEPATVTPTDDHLYMKVSFYPDHNADAPATSPPFCGTPVLAVLDLGSGWSHCPGCGEFWHDPMTFTEVFARLDASNVFNAGATDRTCGVLLELYADAALTRRRVDWGIMHRANFSLYLVGSSDYFCWRDTSGTGIILNDSTHRSGGAPTNMRAPFLAFSAAGCGPGGICCRGDFDADGNIGSDQDIEAFFACLAGDCCLECPPNADFNCDGDPGTDADIESFFRVLAGRSC